MENSECLISWKHMCHGVNSYHTIISYYYWTNKKPCKNPAAMPCQLTKLQLKMLIWLKTSTERKLCSWQKLGFKLKEGKNPSPPVQTMEHQLSELESEPVNGKWEVSLEGWLAQPSEDRFNMGKVTPKDCCSVLGSRRGDLSYWLWQTLSFSMANLQGGPWTWGCCADCFFWSAGL